MSVTSRLRAGENTQPIGSGEPVSVNAARSGRISLRLRAWLALRHRVRSSCGPISPVARRSSMPARAELRALPTGGEPETLMPSSTRSLSNNTPRTPRRSARKNWP